MLVFSRATHPIIRTMDKLIASGLIVYLIAIIGVFAPIHKHGDSHGAHVHADCQLCQVSSESVTASVGGFEFKAYHTFSPLLVQRLEPCLISRHGCSASRGPPSV